MVINSYPENIENSDIEKLDLLQFDGEVNIINSDEGLDEAYEYLRKQEILGFDTETRPNFVKGVTNNNKVSVLQLSTKEKAFVIQLKQLNNYEKIKQLLEDKNIIKIGVAVTGDIRELHELIDFNHESFIDLQTYTMAFKIEANSLKKLTAIILEGKISKRQQLSNWENKELTKPQISYAATDAWLCYMIYKTLKNEI